MKNKEILNKDVALRKKVYFLWLYCQEEGKVKKKKIKKER